MIEIDKDNLLPVIRQNMLPIFIGSFGVILILLGFIQVFTKTNNEPSLVLEKAETSNEEIVVDVEGALMNPGVYKLSSSARMVDALAIAGGLSESADRVWVEKNINLAKRISDGLKIYIPRVGEEVDLSQDSSIGEESGDMIDINSASITELESLPGVGSVTAQKIIDGRPYSSVEELLSKKLVGKATFEKIKSNISTQ